jgi:TolB-like protein
MALLALAPGGVRGRAWLQTMLWGSRFHEQAQASLRRELATLCSILESHGAGALVSRTINQIALDLDQLDVDVLSLGVGVDGGRGPAIEGGFFLEDIELPCEEFQDWLASQRKRVAAIRQIAMPAVVAPPSIIDTVGAPLQPTRELLDATALTLSPKPSVCVVPFRTIGQEVDTMIGPGFADELGITLARFPTLFVVASNSAAALSQAAVPAPEIAHRLGVKYLIEGTIRHAARQVRVSVALVDGGTGEQIWTASYNGGLDDIFDLQSRIAGEVAPHIDTQIDITELRGALINPLRTGDAYSLYWRANALFRQWNREAILEALELSERLVAMQPMSARAAALAAFCHAIAFAQNWARDPGETRRAAIRHHQQAMRFGSEDPAVLGYAAGTLLGIGGDLDVADTLIAHALTLLPSYQPTLFWGGWVDLARGSAVRARERFELSLRINPAAGMRAYTITGIGLARLMEANFQEAFELFQTASAFIPDHPITIVGYCVAAAMSGHGAEAKAAAATVRATGALDAVFAILPNPAHHALIEAGVRHAEAG